MITMTCPECLDTIKASSKHAGKRGTCAKCGTAVKLPYHTTATPSGVARAEPDSITDTHQPPRRRLMPPQHKPTLRPASWFRHADNYTPNEGVELLTKLSCLTIMPGVIGLAFLPFWVATIALIIASCLCVSGSFSMFRSGASWMNLVAGLLFGGIGIALSALFVLVLGAGAVR